MVLDDPAMIQAERQYAETDVTGMALGNADDVDNEDGIDGQYRKVRRVSVYNLDNVIQVITFVSGVTGTPATALGKGIPLSQYGYQHLSPEDAREAGLFFLVSATDNRLQAYLDNAPTLGVKVCVEYYDDISP